MKKDLISLLDVRDDIFDFLSLATDLKATRQRNGRQLQGQTLAMIFEKSSTRTRVSFETGMFQLGGNTIYLSQNDSQLGRGETVADTAQVLSRYVDGMIYRAFDHKNMVDLAKHSTVPVINALDNLEHPCQVMADLLTIMERKKEFEGLKFAYIGDGNNVCNSLALGAALVGMDFVAATPMGYSPDTAIMEKAASIARTKGHTCDCINDPQMAAKDADVLYTDTWVSMGQECEAQRKEKVMKPYQINKALMSLTNKDSMFMHCLPAHRGHEVTDDVMDGKHSVVFDQAENRLHAQKAILIKLMG
jgi:ornithine carbamoyltransferase